MMLILHVCSDMKFFLNKKWLEKKKHIKEILVQMLLKWGKTLKMVWKLQTCEDKFKIFYNFHLYPFSHTHSATNFSFSFPAIKVFQVSNPACLIDSSPQDEFYYLEMSLLYLSPRLPLTRSIHSLRTLPVPHPQSCLSWFSDAD